MMLHFHYIGAVDLRLLFVFILNSCVILNRVSKYREWVDGWTHTQLISQFIFCSKPVVAGIHEEKEGDSLKKFAPKTKN